VAWWLNRHWQRTWWKHNEPVPRNPATLGSIAVETTGVLRFRGIRMAFVHHYQGKPDIERKRFLCTDLFQPDHWCRLLIKEEWNISGRLQVIQQTGAAYLWQRSKPMQIAISFREMA
jgi:hypothetical protein